MWGILFYPMIIFPFWYKNFILYKSILYKIFPPFNELKNLFRDFFYYFARKYDCNPKYVFSLHNFMSCKLEFSDSIAIEWKFRKFSSFSYEYFENWNIWFRTRDEKPFTVFLYVWVKPKSFLNLTWTLSSP